MMPPSKPRRIQATRPRRAPDVDLGARYARQAVDDNLAALLPEGVATQRRGYPGRQRHSGRRKERVFGEKDHVQEEHLQESHQGALIAMTWLAMSWFAMTGFTTLSSPAWAQKSSDACSQHCASACTGNGGKCLSNCDTRCSITGSASRASGK